MTAIEMLAAISGTKSLSVLDGFARTIWTDWAEGKLTDDQAGTLAEMLERRKNEVRGYRHCGRTRAAGQRRSEGAGATELFPRRSANGQFYKTGGSRSSGGARWPAPVPCRRALACLFTTGELAALADRRRRGARPQAMPSHPRRDLGAGRRGVSTARNALRYAAREGLVTIEERRRDKRPNLSNVVRIVLAEWTAWIERGRTQKTQVFSSEGGGCKKTKSTDIASSRSSCGERASRVPLSQISPEDRLKAA